MLPLISERFERFTCRALFIALCWLPTWGVAGWTYHQRLPGHRAACEASLARQLSLSVKLAEIEHTRPGGLRLKGVELREPETQELIGRAAQIDATRYGDDWWFTFAEPELTLAGCHALGERLALRMRGPSATLPGKIHIVAPQARLISDQTEWTIAQLAGRLISSRERVEAQLVFRWPDTAAQAPVALKLVRDRNRAAPSTRIDLQTGEAPFPLGLVEPWLAASAWLGRDATLVGRFSTLVERSGRPWGIHGRLDRVDLEQLVGARFAHELSGVAQIELEAQGSGERLERGKGWLVGQGGVIGRSLITALETELHMPAARLPGALGNRLQFEELALAFDVADDGALRLAGGSHLPAGAVLVDRNGVLVSQPAGVQQTVGLIRALARPNQVHLPSGASAELLTRALPLRVDVDSTPRTAAAQKKERAQGQR